MQFFTCLCMVPFLIAVFTVKLGAQTRDGDWTEALISPPPGKTVLDTNLAEKIKNSKVPDARTAVSLSLAVHGMDARDSIPNVVALLRLAEGDPEMGAAGDFVWEVRMFRRVGNIVAIIWVSTTTAKARIIYPAAVETPPAKRAANAAQEMIMSVFFNIDNVGLRNQPDLMNNLNNLYRAADAILHDDGTDRSAYAAKNATFANALQKTEDSAVAFNGSNDTIGITAINSLLGILKSIRFYLNLPPTRGN